MAVGFEGKVSFATLPSLDNLLELDEVFMDELNQLSKSGDLYEVVVLRSELELWSYFLLSMRRLSKRPKRH